MQILIADDDSFSRGWIQSLLTRWGYEVLPVADGQEAWKILQTDTAPHLMILDWMMPGMNGPQLCRRVRGMPGGAFAYILLLTARDSRDDILAGLDAGADDYLVKPIDAREFRVRIRCGKRVVQYQKELIDAQKTLEIQATHDELTGLLNRRALMEHFQRQLLQSKRQNQPLSVVMIDLDRFKTVNDTYGHSTGDRVLIQIAQRISQASRAYDLVGRYGGEEFMVLLPDADSGAGKTQAERLRKIIAETPVDLPDRSLRITLSLGVACNDILPETDMDSLIRAADSALYEAKRNGRNRTEVASNRNSIAA